MPYKPAKRIDFGIKRGPKKPGPKPGQPSKALAVLNRDSIITQMAQGKLLSQVAQSLGITPAAISQQLSQDKEYLAARQNGAELRLDQQYMALESADDSLTLARARETWKAATWFAEREFPERWGQSNRLTVTNEPLSAVDQELLGSAQEMLRLFKARSAERVVEDVNAAPALAEKPVDNQ